MNSVTCTRCNRPVPDKLFAAHLRRHDGTDWVSRRRPVAAPAAGSGNRSRDNTEGRGRSRPRYRAA